MNNRPRGFLIEQTQSQRELQTAILKNTYIPICDHVLPNPLKGTNWATNPSTSAMHGRSTQCQNCELPWHEVGVARAFKMGYPSFWTWSPRSTNSQNQPAFFQRCWATRNKWGLQMLCTSGFRRLILGSWLWRKNIQNVTGVSFDLMGSVFWRVWALPGLI